MTMAKEQQEPEAVAEFEAMTLDQQRIVVQPGGSSKITVVCFVGVDCPLAKLYSHRLNSLASKFAESGVKFLAIDSNHQDSLEKLQGYVREHSLSFPMVADPTHRLADHFQAKRTPEVFVLDSELKVCYRGRIDDQYQPGISRSEPRRRDLELAITQLLAGEQVEVARTEAVGCLIGRVVAQSNSQEDTNPAGRRVPTFAEDVAPVVYRHCGECHRPHDIAPFSLIGYDEVKGWGAMMVEVIDQGLMPPWHANPEHGTFANHRHMPDTDKKLIRDWVAAGAPLGDVAKLPPAPEPAGDWLLPHQPDLVVAMGSTPFEVPAQGTVDYKYFVVDPGFTEDHWIKGAQIIPGNRSVVHHSIVFIKPPDEETASGQGWLAAYVPGQRPLPYAPGYARRIPAGSKFVFQQHYTTNGKPASDVTKIGLVFANPAEVTHAVDTLVALNQHFEIPPYHGNYQVQGSLEHVPQQAQMLGLAPHMHYRGKSFQLTAIRSEAEGDSRIILDVPRYDFNWQHVYAFAEPLPLQGISRIDFVAAFDNSVDNPANPDPTQTVTWGDQSWEEMAIVYFDVAWRIRPGQLSGDNNNSVPTTIDSEDGSTIQAPAANQAHKTIESQSTDSELEPAVDIEQKVEEFFHRFASPAAAAIPEHALPEAIRRFADLDKNDDGEISRDELRQAFHDRYKVVTPRVNR
ncbi:MAG: redoxin domain-containing protein [Planctomycetaceae bacterium]|nr:redoxin domain-containing protein [Planctomycetaceae bacterium]